MFNFKKVFVSCSLVALSAACAPAPEAAELPSEEIGSVADPANCPELGGNVYTVLNLLKPSAEERATMLEHLHAGLDREIRAREGFISASVHESLDNDYVLNYAQWRSPEALQQTVQWVQEGNAPNMAAAYAVGMPEFHPFSIVSSHYSSGAVPVRIDCNGEAVTVVNFMRPNKGVDSDTLAAELAEAMQKEVASTPGFGSATIHQSQPSENGAWIVNYAQWDSESALGTITERLQAGSTPELAEAFALTMPDFHPMAVTGVYRP